MEKKIYCYCSNCDHAILEDDRHMRIPQGETYLDFIAEDGDIVIYKCDNCGNKIYGA